MRHSGRGLAPCRARALALVRAALAMASLLVASAAFGREVSIVGTPMKGFARIELRFSEPTKVSVRTATGVLVIGFDRPTTIKSERLSSELASLVSIVRRDPDDTGLRVALGTPVRSNLLEAGERVFIDLLPPNWAGLPPALPPEVVAELAERARVAEEKLRGEEGRRIAARKAVLVRVAELSTMTRFVFEPPPGTPIRFATKDGALEAVFTGALALDLGGARPKGAAGIGDFTSVTDDASLTVRIVGKGEYRPHGFTEDDSLVVDVAKPSLPPPALPVAAARPRPVAAASEPAATERVEPRRDPQVARKAEDPRPEPAPALVTESKPAPAPPPPPVARVAPVFQRAPVGSSILFPFAARTAAAAYESGGRVTLVFDTPDKIDVSSLSDAVRDVASFEPVRHEQGFAVVGLRLAEPAPVRLLSESSGWRLSIGRPDDTPPDEARVSRATAADGQPQIVVALPTASAVHWLVEPSGGRIAVVTVTGRPTALATGRRYVEFSLLGSIAGAVVEALADDVTVGLGQGGAVIARKGGLLLSSVSASGTPTGDIPLVVNREMWLEDGSGNALDHYRELIAASATARRSGLGEARLRLASFMLANGLSVEATSLLALARSDDPLLASRRESSLLAAIASARSGRLKEARTLLGSDALMDDPEAILWRAVVAARDRQWSQGLAGFKRSADVLSRYPEALAGELLLVATGVALEAGDVMAAESFLATVGRLPSDALSREGYELVRARFDEAAGRTDVALKAYERLSNGAPRPIEAEATLRAIELGRKLARLPPEEATRRYEMLAVSWRGDEIELRSLAELTRLHAAAGKWREMLTATRRINTLFPRSDLTRALYDETSDLFQRLLLGDELGKLPAEEILALYYDFKEFTPIGRRGDEIVRRLADRLVELDLLDPAGDLLQYQVDRRLTGTARAAVAARLAAIRLMAGKPLMALNVLAATRLAELPSSLRRFRLLMEAQAHADLTRIDLALEILDNEQGPAFARLRAGLLFGAYRWREAGEAYEALVGTRWQGEGPLTDDERADVMRAAAADVLGAEPIALERLRTKFGRKMVDSPDSKAFELTMRPAALRSPEFRVLLREMSKGDTLRRLLADWTNSQDQDARRLEGTEAEPKREARNG